MEMGSLLELTKDIKVLYVEDDDTLREKTAPLLRDLFFDLHEAVDGLMGLRMYKEALASDSPYDLIISDIKMPNMDGIEMCQNILQINPDQEILIFSAYNDFNLLIDLMALGVTHYIQKPIQIDQLREKLTDVCQNITDKKENLKLQQAYTDFHNTQEEKAKNSAEKIISDVLHQPEDTVSTN